MAREEKKEPIIDLIKEGYPQSLALALAGRELSAPRALLEKYPRIVEKLGKIWGRESDFKAYINDLAFNDRIDERQGFEPEVLQDVFFLKELHEALHGQTSKPGGSALIGSGRSRIRPAAFGVESASVKAREASSSRWPMESDMIRVKARMEARRMGKAHVVPKKLGEIMVGVGCVDEQKLEVALRAQLSSQGPKRLLGEVLIGAGFAKSEDVQRALCMQQGIQILDMDNLQFEATAAKIIPRDVELSKRIIGITRAGPTCLVAMSEPMSYEDMEWLGFVVGGPVEIAWASEISIERRLAGVSKSTVRKGSSTEAGQHFKEIAAAAAKPIAERKAQEMIKIELARAGLVGAEDPTVADMVRKMVSDAKRIGASDIHIEAGPRSESAIVRMRVDGELSHYAHYEKAAHEAVVSRIKILANMDISERRRPQDGKLSVSTEMGERIEARVSSIPSVGGQESMTLRLISAAEPVEITKLGMDAEQLQAVEFLLACPHGLALVCGPTGSGKTTTLHSMLAKLNTPERKIWTVEDPVEIVQEGLVQTQAQPKIGYGFDAALRAFMRADPDVIMVGEVRDSATASAALEASLTGHLVLSTLHTNSACETAARLLDLGVDPFAFSDSLRGIVAQRLARKLCSCAPFRRSSPSELDELAREHCAAMGNARSSRTDRDRWLAEMRKKLGGDLMLRDPLECEECRGTGHRGRIGVHEVLIASVNFKRALCEKGSGRELLRIALEEGFKPLKARALELVCAGHITLSEARSISL